MLINCLAFITLLWPTPGHTMQPSSSNAASIEQIDHAHLIVSDINNLYLSNRFSDVVLVVEGERFHAHRFLLASHSQYFSVLLYGGLIETYEEDVKIKDVPVALFKLIHKYIYTGRLNLSDLEGGDIFELLKMADFFGISILKLSLHKYLRRSIKLNDIWSFLTMTQVYQFKELEEESLNLIQKNALEALKMEDFLNLSLGALLEILNNDLFFANELVIFNAVCGWINVNQVHLDRDTIIKVLSAVRYSLMSDAELFKAKESQLVSSDIILDAIQLRRTWTSDKPQIRGQIRPNEYLFFKSHSSPVTNVNLIHRSHDFSFSNNILGTNMIQLFYPLVINYIKFKLQYGSEDDHLRSYSYYIEVSKNGHDWVRIVDYSNYKCRSVQRLWLHPQIVWYIHIVGTNSTPDATFKVEEVRYNTKDMHKFEINNGLVDFNQVPIDEFNATSRYYDAIVVEGKNSVKHFSLLDYYDSDEGYLKARNNCYTYHLLGSGSLVVHLRQPYILSSMRMLLWGGENQTYNYTVEVSVDDREWITIVDKSKEPCRSWQLFQFEAMAIALIRITGVHSSTDNEFRCVYLEAPVQATPNSNDDEDDVDDDV